jgi:hypothetical protein
MSHILTFKFIIAFVTAFLFTRHFVSEEFERQLSERVKLINILRTDKNYELTEKELFGAMTTDNYTFFKICILPYIIFMAPLYIEYLIECGVINF